MVNLLPIVARIILIVLSQVLRRMSSITASSDRLCEVVSSASVSVSTTVHSGIVGFLTFIVIIIIVIVVSWQKSSVTVLIKPASSLRD